jgi:CMP-N,N'-diacetyllegionaminic acid synthase
MIRKIVACIPARGGCKKNPRKNKRLLNGKPLIAHIIKAALGSKMIDRVLVSTDDPKIAKIAKKYGAEVPFLRPAELAQDTTPTFPVLQHAVTYLKEKEGYQADLLVVLQPTSPLTFPEDIDSAITKLINTKTNACVSVCEIGERPEWMYVLKDERPKPFLNKIPYQKRFQRSQILPKIFRLNGAISVVKVNNLMKKDKVIDESSLSAIIMPREHSVDIDELIDFKIAELLLKGSHEKNNQNKQ